MHKINRDKAQMVTDAARSLGPDAEMLRGSWEGAGRVTLPLEGLLQTQMLNTIFTFCLFPIKVKNPLQSSFG